jgi:ABC-type antimicrobial peptide transport system permease subunit
MSPWFRRKREAELEEELQAHLRMAAQDRLERGESREEAEASTRLELGNIGLIKEVTREMWGWTSVERLLQDLRFGARMLRRNPVFTAVVVLTLALGIGASTAIFSVVYGVLLRPLQYERPEQIVRVFEVDEKGAQMQVADPNFEDFRAQNHTLQGVAQFHSSVQSVAGGSEPRRLRVANVSHDFFSVMGVQPVRGRLFVPEEQHVGASPAALVSYSYWQQYLNGASDLSVVKLRIANQLTAVVGVMPPGFGFPNNIGNSDIWVPRETDSPLPARSAHNWWAVARLREGVSAEQAQADLGAIARRLKQQYGQDIQMEDAAVIPLQTSMTGNARLGLLMLLAAVGLLLLVACANVMNLLLAQAAARQGELGICTALGASRGRLVRQFLAETLLLGVAGGTLGVLAAYFGVRALLMIAPRTTPRLEEVSVNLPVLSFALALTILVAAGLGILTALRATGGDVQSALAEGGRGQGNARSSHRLGRIIIAGQMAMTLLLLVGAGLLARSLLRVLSVDPGFRTERIVAMDLSLPEANGAADLLRRTQFVSTLLDRLRVLPGVQQAGGTSFLPLAGTSGGNGAFVLMNEQQLTPQTKDLIEASRHMSDKNPDPKLVKALTDFFEQLFRDPNRLGQAEYIVVSDDYFGVLGVPLIRGRFFDARDGAESPHVAIISESLARSRWPNQDPLGQTIEFGNMDGDLRLLTVVGVVGDVHERSLEAPARPAVYVNVRQRPVAAGQFSVVLRTTADPGATLSSARKVVSELDPNIPPKSSTLVEVITSSLHTRRFNLIMVGTFAGAAVLLAMAGIYGVLAYWVARRTREIGVRMALGASDRNVRRLVLQQAVLTAVAGVALGLLVSFLLTRSIQSLLFEVSATDPLTFAGVAFLLILVAMVASYMPARRATKVDPMVALRHQ